MKHNITRIGKPGKFNQTFGIIAHEVQFLMEPLYIIVWLDSGEQVLGTGGFFDPIQAENYVEENHQSLIDKQFERDFLT